MTDKQSLMNQIAQLEADSIHHQIYGSRYLLKSDGSIVIRTPEGNEMPIPIYEEGDDT